MNFRRFIIALGLAAAVAACKKDEDTTSLPYLDGYLMIEGMDAFAIPGQVCTLTVKGLSHPEDKEIGYYWRVVPTAPQSCTTDVFTFTVTDTLQTCTVYCYAYADGYSSSSSVQYYTVVKGGRNNSIKGIEYPEGDEIVIGTQTWTIRNASDMSDGQAFKKAAVMSDVFGRYYNYQDAKTVCSSLQGGNWKLPTNSDWDKLTSYISSQIEADKEYAPSVAAAMMGNATFNGTLMWEYWPNVGTINNAAMFGAIPAGYATFDVDQDSMTTDYSNSIFNGVYEYAAFWADADNDDDEPTCRYIICDQPDIYTYKADTLAFGASVRCILK